MMDTLRYITKLDLGGTACYEAMDAVILSIDGSGSGDTVSPRVIGDYRHPPFSLDHFAEALGSCFLEELDEDYVALYESVAHHMKSGSILHVSSCGAYHPNHWKHGLAAGLELMDTPGLYWSHVADDGSGYGELWYDGSYVWQIP